MPVATISNLPALIEDSSLALWPLASRSFRFETALWLVRLAKKKKALAFCAEASRRSGRCREVRPDHVHALLDRLAVQREIETVAFDLFADAQADDEVEILRMISVTTTS